MNTTKNTPIFRRDLQRLLSEQLGSHVIVSELSGKFRAHLASGDGDVEVPAHFVPARYNWKPVIGSAFFNLEKAGLTITHVNNGDGWEEVSNRKEAVWIANVCDDCRVRVQNAEGQGSTVYIVLGNHPEDLFTDWTLNPATDAAVDAAVEAFGAIWEGKRCPVVAA